MQSLRASNNLNDKSQFKSVTMLYNSNKENGITVHSSITLMLYPDYFNQNRLK